MFEHNQVNYHTSHNKTHFGFQHYNARYFIQIRRLFIINSHQRNNLN